VAPTEVFASSLFHAIGRPELCEDERFRTRDARVQNVAEVDRVVGEFTAVRQTEEVVAILAQTGVPAAAVRSPAEAVRDPQVVARGETIRLQHSSVPDADVYGPGLPIVFSGSTAGFDQPPPGIGEHNGEVYGDLLGYTQSELRELQSTGVI
jgi:crotonobetainyl-CoA:carnitine CoA-transferase CaiB-like acyl-CoA transferase